MTLRCDPISGHIFVYWYRQNLRHEMEFLISFLYQNIAVKSGMPKERFSAERPTGTYSTLTIQPTELGDSALYLCASAGIGTVVLARSLQGANSLASLLPCPRLRKTLEKALPLLPGSEEACQLCFQLLPGKRKAINYLFNDCDGYVSGLLEILPNNAESGSPWVSSL